MSFKFHRCLVLLLSPSHKASPGPQTPGGLPGLGTLGLLSTAHSSSGSRAQTPRQAFVYFGRVRQRASEGGDAQAERRLRRRQVPRAPPPVPGPGAETERGVTKRRRNAEVSALAPRALSGPEARPSLSRLGPASAGRALRPRWAQPLSRRRLGAAKHPGRTRSRRKVA